MTFNDVAKRLAADLAQEYDKEFGNRVSAEYADKNMIHIYSNEERDLIMRRDGYEKAMDVVRQVLYKIVTEEIKSKNLDFLL